LEDDDANSGVVIEDKDEDETLRLSSIGYVGNEFAVDER